MHKPFDEFSGEDVERRILSEKQIEIAAVPVDEFFRSLKESRAIKIVVLDPRSAVKWGNTGSSSLVAALNNSLASVKNQYMSDTSILVAYSAAPKTVAHAGERKKSIYGMALVKWITAPDLTIDEMFHKIPKDVVGATNGRQHPNTINTMVTDYVLNPLGSEWVDWANAKNSTDIDALQHFVDAHPDSLHAPQIWDRIHKSTDPFPDSPLADATQAVLDKLDLERRLQDEEKGRTEDQQKAAVAVAEKAALEQRAAEAKAAEENRLAKEKADSEAAAKALAEKQAELARADTKVGLVIGNSNRAYPVNTDTPHI